MKFKFECGKTKMKAEVTEKELKLMVKLLQLGLLIIIAVHGGAP